MRLSLLPLTVVLVCASMACGDRPSPVEPAGANPLSDRGPEAAD